jgi:hypothetical protein
MTEIAKAETALTVNWVAADPWQGAQPRCCAHTCLLRTNHPACWYPAAYMLPEGSFPFPQDLQPIARHLCMRRRLRGWQAIHPAVHLDRHPESGAGACDAAHAGAAPRRPHVPPGEPGFSAAGAAVRVNKHASISGHRAVAIILLFHRRRRAMGRSADVCVGSPAKIAGICPPCS